MPGSLRNPRERLRQTLCFEAGGLLLVAPLFSLSAGTAMSDSFTLIVVLTLLMMLWSTLFNVGFDLVEHGLSGRLASERPQRLRVLHALLHEGSAVVVTCPTIVAMTGLSWSEALVADLGLTLAYALYAYLFHLLYDACRPVTNVVISSSCATFTASVLPSGVAKTQPEPSCKLRHRRPLPRCRSCRTPSLHSQSQPQRCDSVPRSASSCSRPSAACSSTVGPQRSAGGRSIC